MGAKNPLSCGAQCSRITLVTLNVVFLLCGIAFLVLGLVVRFGDSSITEDLKAAVEKVQVGDYNLYTLLSNLSILFIIIGAVVIVFAILGFVGALCYVRCALVLYAILLGICLVAELAGVILFFIMRNKLESGFKKGMKEVIEEANEGKEDALKATQLFFKSYECCHVDQKRLNNTMLGEAQATCALSATANGKDCYDAFVDWIKSYQGAFIGIGIAIMVVEVILIILSCWICRVASKKEELV